jgi:hypothetical protein
MEMDIRIPRGVTSMPSPIKPYVSQMVLAAYANDPVGFRAAYQKALMVASKAKAGDPQGDPYADVAEAYQRMHPLKSVFNKPPTTIEYQRLIAALKDDGREVSHAIANLNAYGAQIPAKRGGAGIKPFYGTDRAAGSGQRSGGDYRDMTTGARSTSDYRSLAAMIR